MKGQKKLSSFFKPSNKRETSDDLHKSPKKVKTDSVDYDSSPNKEEGKKVEEQLPNPEVLSEMQNIISEINVYAEKYAVLSQRIGPSWFKALKGEFDKPYFKKLNDFVITERSKHTIYPEGDQVWTWTRQCSIDNIKVVILGQDPYHNPGQAHGLCFSVPVGINPPPSLLNIYKELESDIIDFKRPKHGYLAGWARQGVLLLNAVLTVRKNEANAHKDRGWEDLTTAVIKYLNENNDGIVFLLWGAYAQKKADFVNKVMNEMEWEGKGHRVDGQCLNHLEFADDVVLIAKTTEELSATVLQVLQECKEIELHINYKNSLIMTNKHCILKTVHPSPLSASRGFLGCKHFSKCNEFLESRGKRPIDWSRLPEK